MGNLTALGTPVQVQSVIPAGHGAKTEVTGCPGQLTTSDFFFQAWGVYSSINGKHLPKSCPTLGSTPVV